METAAVKSSLKNFRIRWLIKRDLPAVLAIDDANSCFPSPVGGKWTKKDFLEVLGDKGNGANNTGIVAVQWQDGEEVVVGFCIYGLMKEKIHVHNMVVRKDLENNGIGAELIDRMKGKLGLKRRNSLDFDIRESNLRAQLFLRKHGFKAVNVVRNWYESPQEDCYKFRYSLEE